MKFCAFCGSEHAWADANGRAMPRPLVHRCEECGEQRGKPHAPECLQRAETCSEACASRFALLPADEQLLRCRLAVALEMLDGGYAGASELLRRELKGRRFR